MAGVVVHKRHGNGKAAEQYVSMTLETFVTLLEGGSPNYRHVDLAKEVTFK